jgi:hypothetical protein
MKRIFASLMALTILSATLYADSGKITTEKVKTECCSMGCCDESCTNMNSKIVYAAKRGIILFKSGGCTCC